MANFLKKAVVWFESTHIPEQLNESDIVGLFTNPWFLVPFVCLLAYLLYNQDFKVVIVISMCIGVWWVSGTEYMHTLTVNGEIQPKKIIPVAFGGAAALGFLIYIFFGRSD